MENQQLISVVIPIYKVEKYLDRCIESIVNQTYQNLEIILVDDGSPDNCPRICEVWARKDNRIKVIHKENGGLSDARNAGMRFAKGEYIAFVDSDDFVSKDFFETLIMVAFQEDSDIVECNVTKFYGEGQIGGFADDLSICTYNPESALSGLIAENPFHQHVWNKLYKVDCVKGILFPIGKLNEDEFWTYQVFGRAKRVTKINKTMYFYFQRRDSIMGEKYSIRRLDALEGKANRQDFIQRSYPSLTEQSKIDFYGSCIFAYQSVLKYLKGKEKTDAIDIIKRYKQKCTLSVSEIMKIHGSSKKYLLLSKISFDLCCRFRAVANIGF